MPFTGNRLFKSAPRFLIAAEGMHYVRADGGRVLDATSGLWCVNAGHGRREIAEAVGAQLARLDYAPAFQMGHAGAFELAARLAAMLPQGLDRVFFTNSGSESVDTALKIALAYHQIRGEGQRFRLIGRERAYHGVGFGGISVGGIANNRRQFGPLLPGADHLCHTHHPEKNAFSRGEPAWGAELADDLERIVALHGASTIAAVIVEPFAGSAGVLVPPKGYLKRLRDICDRHGILLIFDEVITGFGRVGAAFAADHFGVIPDIITLAKGLTNGAVPMGAVGVRRGIHDAFMAVDAPEIMIELFHGYTYSGHPVACAAALATLDIYRDEGLFERARALAPYLEERIHALKGHPFVTDIRNLGMVAAVELEPRQGRPSERAFEVYLRCFEAGLLIRTTGDAIALSPPLVATRENVDQAIDILADALKNIN
ncbi:MAG: aspartate aminotransferase family protein [Alphaproteobacteria bacterium]